MNKCYYRIEWKNYPSDETPLNEQNLNKIDVAVDEIDNRIISLDSTKFDKSEAQLLVKYIEYDENTGIFKITHYNDVSYTIDTLLEKLAVNFDYDYQTQQLIIELSDGEIKYVDLSALITQYEFLNSNTVNFNITAGGKVTADIAKGSIEEMHLRPDYLADIKVEAAKAEASQKAAETSEKNAKASEAAAKISENCAADANEHAALSAISASEYVSEARDYAHNAEISGLNAAKSEERAADSADSAETSASGAKDSAVAAQGSASSASQAADIASEKVAESSNYSAQSKSYAVGGTGTRAGEDSDNSKYYYEQSKEIYDDFSSAGTVLGVKGSAEKIYRTGLVNITPADMGALKVSSASMEKHPIRDVTHIKNGSLDLDMGWDESHNTAAEVSLGIRNNESADAGWITRLKIGDDDFAMQLPDATGSVEFTKAKFAMSIGNSRYSFPGTVGLLEMRPTNSVIIATPDSFNVMAGEIAQIRASGKLHLLSETEIRLIPGILNYNEAPAADKYVKTGHIKGVKDVNGDKPSISNFGDIRSEAYSSIADGKTVTISDGNIEIDSMVGLVQTVTINHQGVTVDANKEIKFGNLLNGLIASSRGITPIYRTSPSIDLGSSSNGYKWRNIYAENGTIQTSDRNEKNNIKDMPENLVRDFVMGLSPVTYKMNNGTSGRMHWGLISQDIEKLMNEMGMDSKDFAGFVKSPKVIIRNTDDSGNPLDNPIEEVVEGEYNYSLRYDEFVAPLIKVVQMQQENIASLCADKAQLEERLAKIEMRLGF